jgi:alpha-D-xyloside xylohydrolase
MKLRLLLFGFLFFAFINAVLAAPQSYIQTKDGVIVFTDPRFTDSSKAVKPEGVSDNIIRVTAAPGKEIVAAKSLITIYSKKSDLSWNVVSSKEILSRHYHLTQTFQTTEDDGWYGLGQHQDGMRPIKQSDWILMQPVIKKFPTREIN